jgi:hypothetical protein
MTHLIVDVSVARSSGDENARNPDAVACRETLKAIINHGNIFLIITDAILDEWMKIDSITERTYASRCAIKWLISMRSKRRIREIEPININEFDRCAQDILIPEHLSELRKDSHLFYAALSSDRKVISNDKKCWQYAIDISDCYLRIKNLHWVNPNDPYCIDWISSGAEDDQYWCPKKN